MIIDITEDVRQQVLDQIKELRAAKQPEAVRFVLDDIIRKVRKMSLVRVYESSTAYLDRDQK